jgi:hypothetical protein
MGISVFPAPSSGIVGPKDLALQQTLTSSGAVTIPAGITHVWAIVVSGGQAGWTNTGSGQYSSSGRVAGGYIAGWTTAANVVVVGAGGTPSVGLGGLSSYGQLKSPQTSTNTGFIGDGGAGSYYDGQAAAGGDSNFGRTGGTAGGTYTSGGGGAGLLANGGNKVSTLVAGAGGSGGGGGGGNGTSGPAGASGGAGGGGCVLLYY